MLLAYRADSSAYAMGEAIGVTHPTVQRCLGRAVPFGDRWRRSMTAHWPGKSPAIIDDAKAWLVSLACPATR